MNTDKTTAHRTTSSIPRFSLAGNTSATSDAAGTSTASDAASTSATRAYRCRSGISRGKSIPIPPINTAVTVYILTEPCQTTILVDLPKVSLAVAVRVPLYSA
jgi:hypothetical protein